MKIAQKKIAGFPKPSKLELLEDANGDLFIYVQGPSSDTDKVSWGLYRLVRSGLNAKGYEPTLEDLNP